MSTKEQKIQGRKTELPALCFLNLSAHFYVWVTVWVRRLTHILTHTVLVEKARKIPEIMRFQGFSGAAGRIRTADLILTKKVGGLHPPTSPCSYPDTKGFSVFFLTADSSFFSKTDRFLFQIHYTPLGVQETRCLNFIKHP